MNKPLQIGDVVMVYDRPLEFDKPRGLATLISKKPYVRLEGTELWKVRFHWRSELNADTDRLANISPTTERNIW